MATKKKKKKKKEVGGKKRHDKGHPHYLFVEYKEYF